MELIILGNNGPFPAPDGATSGYLVSDAGTHIMLDAGTGTLSRLTARIAPEALDAVILSHWHYDHCSDLLPMIFRLQAAGKQIDLYAPADETSIVRQAAIAGGVFRIHDVKPGDTFTAGTLSVRVFHAVHPVTAVMYRLENAQHATLAYTGDTNQTNDLNDLCRDCSLLLADGLFPKAAWAENKPHLSSAMAAEAAAACNARQLIITHLNPWLDETTLLKEARAFYPTVRIARIGDTYTI